MLDQIEALRALNDTGTMGKAAARLRVTQSAVSKRLAALEGEVGFPLLEPDGRRVRLTPAALRLLDEVGPLLQELRARVAAAAVGRRTRVRLGASESLLSSWLPETLRATAAAAPDIDVEIHAHRGRWVIERLRAGEIDVAVVVGSGEEGLEARALGAEPMVLVPSAGGAFAPEPGSRVPVLTIEPGSLTGAWLTRRLPRLKAPFVLEVADHIESFSAAVQLARAGFGHALVPVGIAVALGVQGWVPVPGLARPIVGVARPSVWARAAFRPFVAALLGSGVPGGPAWDNARLPKGTHAATH